MAQSFQTRALVEDMNRALSEIRLSSGPLPCQKDIASLIRELDIKGYFQKDWVKIDPDLNLISCLDGIYKTPETTFPALSQESLLQHLQSTSDALRSYSLNHLKSPENKEKVLTLIQAYLSEKQSAFFSLYQNLLVQESIWPLLPTSLPANEVEARKAMLDKSTDEVFFYYLLSKTSLAPNWSFDLFSKAIELDYPESFINSTSKQIEAKAALEFCSLLQQGYGPNEHILINVAKNQSKLKPCREALVFILINRNKGQFFRLHSQIMQAVQEASGIQWAGDPNPFLDWVEKPTSR